MDRLDIGQSRWPIVQHELEARGADLRIGIQRELVVVGHVFEGVENIEPHAPTRAIRDLRAAKVRDLRPEPAVLDQALIAINHSLRVVVLEGPLQRPPAGRWKTFSCAPRFRSLRNLVDKVRIAEPGGGLDTRAVQRRGRDLSYEL